MPPHVQSTAARVLSSTSASARARSRHAFCCVVTHETVEGVFFGTPDFAVPSLLASLPALADGFKNERHVIHHGAL